MFIKELTPEQELEIRITHPEDHCRLVWFSNVHGYVELDSDSIKIHGKESLLKIDGKYFAVITGKPVISNAIKIFQIETANQMAAFLSKDIVREIEETNDAIVHFNYRVGRVKVQSGLEYRKKG